MEQLQEQLVEECRDLYDAEKQLVKALPKLAKAVSTDELKQCFLQHAEVTRNQIARLEQVFELLGERAKGKPCKAMKGLVEEANEHMQEHERGEMLDNVLIGAAQKVEHYEIAGYGTVRAIAKTLGNRQVAGLLQDTLKEEAAADKLLTQVALRLQRDMTRAKPEVAEEESAQTRTRKRASAGAKQAGARGSAPTRSRRATHSATKSVGRGAGRSRSARGGAGSGVTTDHNVIRAWAEERGAHPACVKGTGNKRDAGVIRLDFPGYTGEDKLQEISWDEFFNKFDQQGLALLYQERTAGGQKSNFNKLIARETAAASKRSKQGSARRR